MRVSHACLALRGEKVAVAVWLSPIAVMFTICCPRDAVRVDRWELPGNHVCHRLAHRTGVLTPR